MISINNFDRKTFLTLILFSLILNLSWGLIATQLELLLDKDKGFITGLGYLMVYGLTFFLCIDKDRQTIPTFFAITFYFIGTFVISSFIIPLLIGNFDPLFNFALLASTLFSTILIVIIVSRYLHIKFKFLTGAITFIVALITTLFVSSIIKEPKYFDLKIFQAMSIFYTSWQVLTTTILALGVAVK